MPGAEKAKTPKPAAAPKPSVVDQVSQFFQRSFPNINAARQTIGQGTVDNLNKGQYARAAGSVLGGVVRYPLAAAGDFVGRPLIAAGTVAQDIVGGALGSTGSTTDATKAPKAAPATKAAATALEQGAAAPPTEITASDAIRDFITQRLQSGVTNNDLAALAQIGNTAPGLARPVQSAKDRTIGTAAAIADAQFAKAAADAEKIVDPAERAKAANRATDEYYRRLVGTYNGGLVDAQIADRLDEAKGQ